MNERIRLLRKQLGLTLEKFGEHLGVSKVAISRIENGINNVTDQMSRSICREFNVNEEWLRNGTGEMFVVPEDETAAIVSDLLESRNNQFYDLILDIVKTYQTLSPMDQEIIKNFCQQLAETQKNRKD
ncbi:MAG: helix-turn-helix domain-containing protein [Roseburia sp.]|mgnify:CR=1 FL=1